jgi:hypothetical protein
MVSFLWKNFLIGIPKITEGNTPTIFNGNLLPQTATGGFAPITDEKGKDLASSTAQHRPQPAFIELFEHKTPSLVIFENVVRFCRQQSVFEFWQTFDMLDNPSGNALAMNIKSPFQTS